MIKKTIFILIFILCVNISYSYINEDNYYLIKNYNNITNYNIINNLFGGNPFDQVLNKSSGVQFSSIVVNDSGTERLNILPGLPATFKNSIVSINSNPALLALDIPSNSYSALIFRTDNVDPNNGDDGLQGGLVLVGQNFGVPGRDGYMDFQSYYPLGGFRWFVSDGGTNTVRQAMVAQGTSGHIGINLPAFDSIANYRLDVRGNGSFSENLYVNDSLVCTLKTGCVSYNNIFDQVLNTTSNVVFNKVTTKNLTVNGRIVGNGSGYIRDSEFYLVNKIFYNTGINTSSPSYLNECMDDDWFNLTEVGSSPGFDYDFRFTNVESFRRILMCYKYEGSTTHYGVISIYNQLLSKYISIREISNGNTMTCSYWEIDNDANIINGNGNVTINVKHPPSGNPSHDFHIGCLKLIR